MDKPQLKCEKCTKDGILIVASVNEADQPKVYCADHLVEYAQEKKTNEDSTVPEQTTKSNPVVLQMYEALASMRNARLAREAALLNAIESESLQSQQNRNIILSNLELEKAFRVEDKK